MHFQKTEYFYNDNVVKSNAVFICINCYLNVNDNKHTSLSDR